MQMHKSHKRIKTRGSSNRKKKESKIKIKNNKAHHQIGGWNRREAMRGCGIPQS